MFVDGKALVHPLQVQYVHQVLQARLVDNPNPLTEVYNCLHFFCQSLQLEVRNLLFSCSFCLMSSSLPTQYFSNKHSLSKTIHLLYKTLIKRLGMCEYSTIRVFSSGVVDSRHVLNYLKYLTPSST